MQPDAHFRQHHDVDAPRIDEAAFVQAWRVRSRLDALLLADAISPREWLAATAYRRNWITAHGYGFKSPAEAAGAPSPFAADKYTIRRLDALAALRMARRHIGPFACALVEACVIDDASWRNLGRRLAVDHKTARMWTIAAIKMLTSAPQSAYPLC